MDKHISFLFLLVNIVSIANAVGTFNIAGYYWREYEGAIPTDALPAGFDENGRPLYIGQVLVESLLIPGTIKENDDNIYYEWKEQPWTKYENIKILCTEYPENFEWIETTNYDVPKLNKVRLIKGGFEPNFLTYIGRAHTNAKTNIGKVICRETDCLALYTNDNGNDIEYHKFEILTYNPLNQNAMKENEIYK